MTEERTLNVPSVRLQRSLSLSHSAISFLHRECCRPCLSALRSIKVEYRVLV